jgi:hypothetical protein
MMGLSLGESNPGLPRSLMPGKQLTSGNHDH